MKAVKAKNSKIELFLAKELKKKGLKYKRNYKKIIGKPDFAFPEYKLAVFCDSEFWHGKNWRKTKKEIKSNRSFWYKKIGSNIKRDRYVNKTLKKLGWEVLRFWGQEIEKSPEKCAEKVSDQLKLLEFKKDVPFPEPADPKFTFIDLFCGIGGFRIALQNLGGKCVFSSDIDPKAQETYEANFGEKPVGDIRKIVINKDIPDHDILCAGFPCQAFSIAGKKGGFEDTRGTLFFNIAKIIKIKKPKAFFLENVKGLKCHRGGKTLATILGALREDLNYYVPDPEIINAKHFGVPQNRERIYIVGFRKDLGIKSFVYPEQNGNKAVFADIKEKEPVSVKYYLSKQYLKSLIAHKKRHEKKNNGFGYQIINDDQPTNAIVVGGMGRERNLVIDKRLKNFIPITHIRSGVNREGIRRMTPREWARLQGFPKEFKIVVADVHAYKQFGNSVAIPAIQATGKELLKRIY